MNVSYSWVLRVSSGTSVQSGDDIIHLLSIELLSKRLSQSAFSIVVVWAAVGLSGVLSQGLLLGGFWLIILLQPQGEKLVFFPLRPYKCSI